MRLASLLLLSAVACHPPPPGPEAVYAAYVRALAAGKLDDAYALLSSDYQKTHDAAAFARALGTPESRAAAAQLRGRAPTVELHAEVALADGDRLPLVQERGGWRIARDPLDFYSQASPVEALRSFIRAVEAHRYDVVWRFVPARYRASFTVDKLRERWEGDKRADVLGQLDAVRAHLGDPIEVGGDEARLTVGERKQAKLVREDGQWRVETLE